MSKLGLFLEFVAFAMLFWHDEIRPSRGVSQGGGVTVTQAGQEFQLERSFSWISNERIRGWLARYYFKLAFFLAAVGVLLQFGSCP